MRRSRGRGVSRILVSFLLLVVAVGLVVHFLKSKSSAVAQATATPVVAESLAQAAATPVVAESLAQAAVAPAAEAPAVSHAGATTSPASPEAPAPSAASPVAVQPVFNTPLLTNAKSKIDAGELVAARGELSEALNKGGMGEGEAAGAKVLLSQIAEKVTFGPKVYPGDTYAEVHRIAKGETLGKIAYMNAITAEELARINRISNPKRIQALEPIKVVKGPFHAVVTKSTFTMDVYLGKPGEAGSVYVAGFQVGLGKDDSTPAGTWLCAPSNKLRNPQYYSPRGEGIIPSGDPRNPLKGFWIGLSGTAGDAVGKKSYGIHGTIEPETVGTMSSMGCIRLRDADIARVFDLLVDGKSTVVVRD